MEDALYTRLSVRFVDLDRRRERQFIDLTADYNRIELRQAGIREQQSAMKAAVKPLYTDHFKSRIEIERAGVEVE